MKANVGMVYPVFAPVASYTPGSAVTYTAGTVVEEAISASVSFERGDNPFHGDDAELDNDNGILGYTISFEPTGINDAGRALLLGETADSSGEYRGTGASAPFGGFGYVRVMRNKGTRSYEGWWFFRLQFGIENEETRTKERNIEWRTPTLTGNGTGVFQSASAEEPDFYVHKSFTTMADAKSWLNGKAGIS